jgi:hypothetical protein
MSHRARLAALERRRAPDECPVCGRASGFQRIVIREIPAAEPDPPEPCLGCGREPVIFEFTIDIGAASEPRV